DHGEGHGGSDEHNWWCACWPLASLGNCGYRQNSRKKIKAQASPGVHLSLTRWRPLTYDFRRKSPGGRRRSQRGVSRSLAEKLMVRKSFVNVILYLVVVAMTLSAQDVKQDVKTV